MVILLLYYFKINKYNIYLFNNIFKTELQNILNNLKENINLTEIWFWSQSIEKNKYIYKYCDDKLYNHQKSCLHTNIQIQN